MPFLTFCLRFLVYHNSPGSSAPITQQDRRMSVFIVLLYHTENPFDKAFREQHQKKQALQACPKFHFWV